MISSSVDDTSTVPVILGIDPGLTRSGVGVIRGPSSRPSLVWYGCVQTATDLPLQQRLLQVHDAIVDTITTYQPTAVAVERVLFSVNTRTAMSTGQAAGVALLAAARANLSVTSYSPNEVKLTVAGSGSADKQAVGRLVAAQLGLERPPRPADAADALAVALTHLARTRLAAATRGTAAASALAEAHAAAASAAQGGWEALLKDRIPPQGGRG